MGSDDLFKKRQARSIADHARNTAKRKPYDKVLIVCEGEKTEPLYFEEIRQVLDIDSANIVIDGTCGSSPRSIVDYATMLFEAACKKNDSYDRVFCVFDRDEHDSFDYAISQIDKLNTKTKKCPENTADIFLAVRSEPSFEYWFLLHFNPTTKPYKRAGKKSSADRVIDDLKTYIPRYNKKHADFYSYSIKNLLLESAKKHSKRIYTAALNSKCMNPSTNVHLLVEYLEKIKSN